MIELLRQRRSIRNYRSKKIESEKLDILKEAVLRSPSSKNINPWKYIFVDAPELITELKNCKPHGVKPLESAPLAVVFCADENLNDAWIEDCSIASILLQLTAQSIDLGSCWIQVRNRIHSGEVSSEQYIQELLNIPKNFRVLNIVSVGYADKQREGKAFNELQFEKIRENMF